MVEITSHLPAATRRSPSRLERLAQSFVIDRLARLERGTLTVVLPDGETHRFGGEGISATIEVHEPAFFRRLLSAADVGAAESYMDGEWTSPDLVALTRLFLDNEALFEPHPLLGRLRRAGDRLLHRMRRPSLRRAPANIAAHYDLSNELYALFLDPTMTYSCALFRSPEETLRQAQETKHRALAEKAAVASGQHVLEIGCGWGGFAEHAARTYGCRVTGITLSNAQAQLARERVKAAGLEHLVEIRVEDYRDVGGTYDAVVSIEMLEAVGHRYLGELFATCDRALRPGGRAAIQVITVPDQIYEGYRRRTDLIRRHIFPGGHLPSLQAMQNAIASRSSLVIQSLENLAEHYAETLRRWRSAFLGRITEVRRLGFDNRFCRMWELYLATCEAGFAHRKLGLLQLALARPGEGAACTGSDGAYIVSATGRR